MIYEVVRATTLIIINIIILLLLKLPTWHPLNTENRIGSRLIFYEK